MRPDEQYESALDGFVRSVLTDPAASEFRRSVRELVQQLLPLSVCHSLSQLVLKCLMPGVPDIYQGDESWALCLTDPDNRLPVDFRLRLETLKRQFDGDPDTPPLDATSAKNVLCADLKQYAATRLLRFRKDHRTMIARAGYLPLRARGTRASASVAFRRTHNREHVIVAVPRLVERSIIDAGWPAGSAFWSDTELRLPSRVLQWTNLLSGHVISFEHSRPALLGELTSSWPWVVLYGHE
jgi:(1->4)-alpha-D-glucan 1-alpha-D-glucosylmutase